LPEIVLRFSPKIFLAIFVLFQTKGVFCSATECILAYNATAIEQKVRNDGLMVAES